MSEQTTNTQETNNESKDRCCGSNKHEHHCHGGHRGRCFGMVAVFAACRVRKRGRASR